MPHAQLQVAPHLSLGISRIHTATFNPHKKEPQRKHEKPLKKNWRTEGVRQLLICWNLIHFISVHGWLFQDLHDETPRKSRKLHLPKTGGVQVFPLSWKVLEYTPFPFVSLHLFIYWSQADGNYWFLPCPVAANHPHDVGQDQHSTYTTKKTTPRSFWNLPKWHFVGTTILLSCLVSNLAITENWTGCKVISKTKPQPHHQRTQQGAGMYGPWCWDALIELW